MEEQSNERRQTWVAGDDITAALVKLLRESHPPVLSRTVADNIPTCLALSLAARVFFFFFRAKALSSPGDSKMTVRPRQL